MRPGLAVILARHAHGWPRPVEFRALLDESETNPREAETLTRQYATAIGSTSSTEDKLIISRDARNMPSI
jgi:hypothetical protein